MNNDHESSFFSNKVPRTGLAKLFLLVVSREWRCGGMELYIGSIPHPVLGTTKDYCRYIKVLLTPY